MSLLLRKFGQLAPMPTYRPPSPLRTSQSQADGSQPAMGNVILLALVCSILTSAATCFAVTVIRFSLLPVPKLSASARPPAPAKLSASPPPPDRPKSGVNSGPGSIDVNSPPEAPDPVPDQAESGLAHPQAAASAALGAVEATLQMTSFVGPNNAGGHAGLYKELTRLQAAAQAVAGDDGSDPAQTARLAAALDKQIDATAQRPTIINQRPTESADSQAATAQLLDVLAALKNQ